MKNELEAIIQYLPTKDSCAIFKEPTVSLKLFHKIKREGVLPTQSKNPVLAS